MTWLETAGTTEMKVVSAQLHFRQMSWFMWITSVVDKDELGGIRQRSKGTKEEEAAEDHPGHNLLSPTFGEILSVSKIGLPN